MNCRNIHRSTLQMGIVIHSGRALAPHHIHSHVHSSIPKILHSHSAGNGISANGIDGQLICSCYTGIIILCADIDFCFSILVNNTYAHGDHSGLIGVFRTRVWHLIYLGRLDGDAATAGILSHGLHAYILVGINNAIHINDSLTSAIIVEEAAHEILRHILIASVHLGLQSHCHYALSRAGSIQFHIATIAHAILHNFLGLDISHGANINRGICLAQIKGHIDLINNFIKNINLSINFTRFIQNIPNCTRQIRLHGYAQWPGKIVD